MLGTFMPAGNGQNTVAAVIIPKTAIADIVIRVDGWPQLSHFFPSRRLRTAGPAIPTGFSIAVFGCAPGKPEATWVKVPPVELDGSRPEEMSGKRPRGRICKRGIY